MNPGDTVEIHRWRKIVHLASGGEFEQQRRLIVRFEPGEATIIKEASDPDDYDWRALEAWTVVPDDIQRTVDDYRGEVA